MMTSFLLAKRSVSIRWECETPKQREDGIIVGADQGALTVTTLSNGIITTKTNKHGYSLESVIKILARKKKGSKAFHKTQNHRENIINWSVNGLNLDNVKELRLEKIVNINYRKRTSRVLSHWTNTLIRDKILSTCELNGVRVVQQDATYRSQRCSNCGLVRKANRKGKFYKCIGCGLEIDADLNAAKNHEQDLPTVPIALRMLRRNLGKGFLWKPNGFFEITGEALTVPLSKNKHGNI
jgi:transposase